MINSFISTNLSFFVDLDLYFTMHVFVSRTILRSFMFK